MDTLDKILYKCGDDLINLYRSKLAEQNINASGLLGNSLSCFVQVDDNVYELNLRIEDYWKYIEYGREPGTFPNIDAIKRWIQIKPVIPNGYNGKLPTLDQLTYLIGRKIERNGIEAKPILQESLDELDAVGNLEEKLGEQVENRINIIFKEF